MQSIMQTERFDIIRRIAAEALTLGGSARHTFVRERCADDHALLEAVQAAIHAAESATLSDEPIGSLPIAANGTPDARPGTPIREPGRLGAYTLLERLGEGGMGLVYLARQDRTERTVALKVIRPEFSSPPMIRRFELEGRMLARLQHAGIAQIFDAGVARTSDGMEQPYVALEHVRGVDIRSHADGFGLDARARIELMIRVCDAVRHAHTKGVIHRDLKPGNILVDQTGQPKVLDFGVARLADRSADQPLVTRAGQIVGTVPYMSPEQIAGDPDAVDTRTDVYALGVVLYELLTGRLPHDVTGKTIVEAARLIESASVEPIGRLRPELRGDIQTVVATAMNRDRERRYQSVADLASDLERCLRNEPIRARPASTLYLAGKFVQRHKPLVGLAAAAVALLVAGVAGTVWQAVRATRGWEVARTEGAAAAAANEFLVRTIASADPENSLGEALTVRQVLDDMAVLAGSELEQQPRVEWSVRSSLARTYRSLDVLDQAEAHARRSHLLASEVFGPESLEALRADREIGMILAQAGRHEEAERIARRGLAVLTERHGASHPERSMALDALARVLHETGRWAEAEPILRESIELGVRVRGGADPEVLVTKHNLATALKHAGRFDEAESLMRDVLVTRERVHGPTHPQTAYSMNNLAAMIQKVGRNEEALALFQRTLEVRRSVLGEEHQSTLTTRMNIAVCLISLGRIAEAEPFVREGLEGYRRTLGEGHSKSLIAMGNLAYLLEEQGKDAEAESQYRRVVQLRRSTQGGRDPETWAAMNNLAMLLQRQGKPEEAERELGELVGMCRESLPIGHYYTAIFENNYADVLIDLGRLDEAEPLLRDSLAVIVSILGDDHARAVRGRERLARLDAVRQDRRAERK